MKIKDRINFPLLYIFSAILLILFVFAYVLPGWGKTEMPKLNGLWILQRVEGVDYASNRSLEIDSGEEVFLYAVFRGVTAEGKELYFSPWKKIEIEGKSIAESSIARWDERWGKEYFLWFRVEGSERKDGNYEYREIFAPDWGFGNRQKADVRKRSIRDKVFRCPNIGEMFYKVRLEIRKEDSNKLITKVETVGAEFLNQSANNGSVISIKIGPHMLIDGTIRQNTKHEPVF